MSHLRNITARNPATGEVIREVAFNTNEEILAKINKSHEAFLKYSQTDVAVRQGYFKKLSEILLARQAEFAAILTRENGKTAMEANIEVKISSDAAAMYAEKLPSYLQSEKIEIDAKTTAETRLLPLGVIYQIIPFNWPLFLAVHSALPCLGVGNTLLQRNADSTPGVGDALEKAIIDAGWSNGEYQTVYTTHDQLELILSNKHVYGVEFTGSTKAGSRIAEAAGRHLKKVVLELGGSDPFIVLDDANLSLAIQQAVQVRLMTCGQVCASPKRMIVHEKIYDQFVAGVIEGLKNVVIGDPAKPETHVGPQARKDLADNTKRQFEEAIKSGAKCLFDKELPTDPALANGFFVGPKVVEVTSRDNILMREEAFGPIFTIFKVKSDAEALEVANDTAYGLGASIYTQDLKKGYELIGKVQSGFGCVNSCGKIHPCVPFGGIKGSGVGRTGACAIREFANVRPIWS